jgi:hypothetical protein
MALESAAILAYWRRMGKKGDKGRGVEAEETKG